MIQHKLLFVLFSIDLAEAWMWYCTNK